MTLKKEKIKPVDSLQGIEELKEDQDIVEVCFEEPYLIEEDYVGFEQNFSDLGNTETVRVLGYVVRNSKNYISICPTRTVGVLETPPKWINIVNIPKKCINEIKRLKKR